MTTMNWKVRFATLFLLLQAWSYACADDTVTLEFPIRDFESIRLAAPYELEIVRDGKFRVHVTVDGRHADAVDVYRHGRELYVGLVPGVQDPGVLEARITLPYLDELQVVGAARVRLEGLEQQRLRIGVVGAARVRGSELWIDELDLHVVGTGGVDLGDAAPVRSARVVLDGVCESTLNMDVDSIISGRLLGVARLNYWGSNVDIDVFRIGLSSIKKLGETKPAGEPASFRINAGLSDAWYDPATSGQGFFLVVWEDMQRIFLSWFTFDTRRPELPGVPGLGAEGQRWFTADGSFSGDTAVLDVYQSRGGVFMQADPPVQPAEWVGIMDIKWLGCNEAVLHYDLRAFGVSGELPIVRLTHANSRFCENPSR